MKKRIRDYSYSSPISAAISVALFAVIIFSLPSVFKVGESATFILNLVFRAFAILCVVYGANACGFKLFVNKKISVSEIFIVILGILVCINNFPFIGLITENVKFVENAKVLRYIVYCASIGIAEEFVYRGYVLPLVAVKFKGYNHAPFLTVLVSSLIFALCHLFNAISFGIGSTLLQVCYTFLTGGLFGITYLITENLSVPIIMHVVFDLGGLVFSQPFGIAIGNMWDIATIIITVVLGIIATTVYVIKLYSLNSKRQYQK